MIEIEQRLKVWREERHLTRQMQNKHLLSNILEELTEYSRANTNYDKIDALCDICVFCLNSVDYDERAIFNEEYLAFRDISVINVSLSILQSLECFIGGDKEQISQIVFACLKAIKEFTTKEPLECLKETIREIESRTGKYVKEKGKFVKDIGAYSLKEAKDYIYKQYGDKGILLAEIEKSWLFSVEGKSIEIVKWYKADYGV